MKNHLQLATAIMLMASFCFHGFLHTATKAEYQLRAMYRAMGIPKKMASYFATRFSNTMQKQFCGKALQKLGIDIESVENLLRLGLLLKLSPDGEKVVHERANAIVTDMAVTLENGLSKTEASNLYTHFRKIVFLWLLDQLSSYDTVSFRIALAFADEKNQKSLSKVLGENDTIAIDFASPVEWFN